MYAGGSTLEQSRIEYKRNHGKIVELIKFLPERGFEETRRHSAWVQRQAVLRLSFAGGGGSLYY